MNEDVFKLFKSSLWNNRMDWYRTLTSFYGRKFIRDFACPQRFISNSTPHLHKQLMYFGAERHKDCYASIYSFTGYSVRPSKGNECPDYTEPRIDRIAFDLDAHDNGVTIKETYRDAMAFYKLFGKSCVIIYTGNSGWHCYIMLDNYITKSRLSVIQKRIKSALNLITACPSTGQDTSRVLRVPYSIHTKTKCQVLPIYKLDDFSTEEILMLSNKVNEGNFINPVPIEYETIEEEKLCSVLEEIEKKM